MRKPKKRGGRRLFSSEQEAAIAQAYDGSGGDLSLLNLAKEYGCSISTIARIVTKVEGPMYVHACAKCGVRFYGPETCKVYSGP